MAHQKVTTVTGDVSGDQLGITLPHEHLHMVFDVSYCDEPTHVPSWPKGNPHAGAGAGRVQGKDFFQLPNLGLLRHYPYSVPYNLALDDTDSMAVMLDEVNRFKLLGGQTIVENTITGINRNMGFLRELSLESGVHIVAGTGYYVAASQSPETLNASVETMYNAMVKDLAEGVEGGDGGSIRCGVVGEIGSSWPIYPFEKRVIEAVAHVQRDTRKPVTFHPGRNPEAPFEIIRLFTEAGGNPRDVIMSHLDRTILDQPTLLDFAELRTFTQFDLFGTECSYYQIQDSIDMPSDAERVQKLGWLKADGRLDQILMSHDIHTKHRLANFGGHGFGHVLQNVVPKMRLRGWTQAELDTVLVGNPRRWLCGGS